MTESKKYVTAQGGHLRLSPDLEAIVQSQLQAALNSNKSNFSTAKLTLTNPAGQGELAVNSSGSLVYTTRNQSRQVLLSDSLFYSASKTYSDGDVCLYQGALYRYVANQSTSAPSSPSVDNRWTRLTESTITRTAKSAAQLWEAIRQSTAECVIVKTEGDLVGTHSIGVSSPVVIIQSDEATKLSMGEITFLATSYFNQQYPGKQPQIYWHCKNTRVPARLTIHTTGCDLYIEHMVAPEGVELDASSNANGNIYYQRIDGTVTYDQSGEYKAPIYRNWCSVVKPDKGLPVAAITELDNDVRLNAWHPSDSTDSYIQLGTLLSVLGSDLLKYLRIAVKANSLPPYTLYSLGDLAYVNGSLYRRGSAGWEGPYEFRGEKGDTGETGPAPELKIGDVSVADSTHEPGVSLEETETGARFNFVLPTGPQGPAGPQGPMGTGLVFKGEWSAETAYEPGDYVTVTPEGETADALWIAVDDIAAGNAQPDEDTSGKWIALQAPDGPQGPIGQTPSILPSYVPAVGNVQPGVTKLTPQQGDADNEVRLQFALPVPNIILSSDVADGVDKIVGAYKLDPVSGDAATDVRIKLTLPQGVVGPAGPQGETGPRPVLEMGTISQGSSMAASFVPKTGEEGTYLLNLVLPAPKFGVSSVSSIAYGDDPAASAAVTWNSTTGKWMFTFGLPQGATGATGAAGHTPDLELAVNMIGYNQEASVGTDSEYEPAVQGDKKFVLNIPRGTPAIISAVTGREAVGDEAPGASLEVLDAAANTYKLNLVLPHGIKGDTGAARAIVIGDVETVGYAEQPEVSATNIGDSSAVLDFKLPRGKSGAHMNKMMARHAALIYGM